MSPVMSSGAQAWVESRVGVVSRVRPLTGGMTSTMLVMDSVDAGPVVLRVIDREPWRSHGAELAARESEVQSMLAGHLMTLLPGRIDPGRSDPPTLGRLADLLAAVHDVRPTIPVRTYQSWAWEAKYVVPGWATRPSVWERAFALLRTAPPAYEPCFWHRDFQPRNVLWDGDGVSGLVDWVEASTGPAWLDVAHCATNLAISHAGEVADAFADAYVARTGRTPQPYFDVMDVVGFMPPLGRPAMITDPEDQRRLEARLEQVLSRAG